MNPSTDPLLSRSSPSPAPTAPKADPMFRSTLLRHLPQTMYLLLFMAYLSITLVVALPLPNPDSVPQPEPDQKMKIWHYNWITGNHQVSLDLAPVASEASCMACRIPGLYCLGYNDGKFHKNDRKEPTRNYHKWLKVSIGVSLARQPEEKKRFEQSLLSVQELQSALDARNIRMDLNPVQSY
ncbi:hypothetical protein F5880DRAFT_1618706 [Lentinula raphanica]|nr:hypothetical protein F5880DRAFT_1618706 [Lentinula raphanica]